MSITSLSDVLNVYPRRRLKTAQTIAVSPDISARIVAKDFSIGDEVVVYYDGNIAESYPMQINTVYAITLKTPADRAENSKG